VLALTVNELCTLSPKDSGPADQVVSSATTISRNDLWLSTTGTCSNWMTNCNMRVLHSSSYIDADTNSDYGGVALDNNGNVGVIPI